MNSLLCWVYSVHVLWLLSWMRSMSWPDWEIWNRIVSILLVLVVYIYRLICLEIVILVHGEMTVPSTAVPLWNDQKTWCYPRGIFSSSGTICLQFFNYNFCEIPWIPMWKRWAGDYILLEFLHKMLRMMMLINVKIKLGKKHMMILHL